MSRILCNYYVTYKCNASCDFCDFKYHEKYKNTKHARLDDVIRNLPLLKKAGVKIIDFTGGEPLLNPYLPEMLEESKKMGFMTTVTSNGLLYSRHAEKLRKKVDLLHFSLDSFDRDQHNEIRGVNCYDHVMRSVDLAISLGEKPDIIFTVTLENYKEVPKVYEYTKNRNLILILNPVFAYFREEGLSEEILAYIEDFSKKPFVYLSGGFVKLRREGGNDINSPVCKAVSKVIVISPDNEVLMPCFHQHEAKVKIKKSLKEVFDTEIYKGYLKKQGTFEFCDGCVINCYFEPSFAMSLNRFMLAGVKDKAKYIKNKYIDQKLKS